jgi:molybdopterin-biosynthesis enzyme MoeA-like protein
VFVLPGIPELVQKMFPQVSARMQHGHVATSELHADISESDFADLMDQAILQFPNVTIGSYPSCKNGRWSSTIVASGDDDSRVNRAATWLKKAIDERKTQLG